MTHVLNADKLKLFNEDNMSQYFGEWLNDIDNYKETFHTQVDGLSNKYVIIKNFLNDAVIDDIVKNFPDYEKGEDWFSYNNPLEVKSANANINGYYDTLQNVYYALSTNQLVKAFSSLTDIKSLEYDPTLYGSAISVMPRHGRLNIHLDYEKHPVLINKERRLNVILYLNKEWHDKWNGRTELWDTNISKCIIEQKVEYNTAIIFETNNLSWHGVPDKLMCPENITRKTLAYYYISPLTEKSINCKNKFGADKNGFRTRAAFTNRPQDKDIDKLEKLYDIRPHKKITQEDMDNIWPEWNKVDN